MYFHSLPTPDVQACQGPQDSLRIHTYHGKRPSRTLPHVGPGSVLWSAHSPGLMGCEILLMPQAPTHGEHFHSNLHISENSNLQFTTPKDKDPWWVPGFGGSGGVKEEQWGVLGGGEAEGGGWPVEAGQGPVDQVGSERMGCSQWPIEAWRESILKRVPRDPPW